ncbi:MAG TPA: secretin N-terminal domain-containing protein [Gemmatimonadota bacterium]|nr:secretin N-terminal domain-containing protein [Gemmatimonadota bacterium]
MTGRVLFALALAGALSAAAPLPGIQAPGSMEVVRGFRVVSDGEVTRVVIETSGVVRYRDDYQPLPPRLTIELLGARPGLALREYDGIQRGGVRYVVASAPSPDRVRLDIALTGVTAYAVYQQGAELHVTFENPGDAFPTFVAEGDARIGSPGGSVTRRSMGPAYGLQPPDPGLADVQGDPVTLSFQGADIETVIRAFGEISGRSIVAGAGARGIRITADIRDRPWDEALVAVMHANGLEVRDEAGIIRVDTVQNLRLTEELVDLSTVLVQLNYIAAADAIPVVTPLKSERGSVTADAKTNSLVVTDIPDRVRRITDIVRELDVQTPQVTIKAKIVFVNKVDLRDLGVKWRLENLRDPTVDTHVLANTEGTLADPFLDLSLGTLASGLNVGGLLQALEQRELADIQAEPQTTVLDNLPAEVFVGERTPIRVLDVGADTPEARASVELIETGIILRVTPHITANGKVLMQLQAERSGVAVTDPAIGVTFNTQRATSQILVDDGETAVIGGLTVQDLSTVRRGVPVLKDIPVLGALFRTERKREEKRDLLIFVTPYIMPVDDPEPETVTAVCLEDQDWFRSDEPVLHNGERWLRFGTPRRMDARSLVATGNYRGVPIYASVETAAIEIHLPLCAEGLYQTYRMSPGIRGTQG